MTSTKSKVSSKSQAPNQRQVPNHKHQSSNKVQTEKHQIPNGEETAKLPGWNEIPHGLKPRDSNPWVERPGYFLNAEICSCLEFAVWDLVLVCYLVLVI